MRTTSHPSALLVSTAVGLALTLTACGSNDLGVGAEPEPSSTAGAPTADGTSSPQREADLAFVRGMHPHHQGALAMAELASSRAQSPEVTALATRIASAQGPELARLEGMAQAWGAELAVDGEAGAGHGDDGHTEGAPDDAAALAQLRGAEFDRQFLRRMTAHHQGALPMARAQLASGSDPRAGALAREIISAQEAEIAEMEQLLADL